MVDVIHCESRIEGWIQATEMLLDASPKFNLLLAISNPGTDGASGPECLSRIDEFLVNEGKYPTHTVAETIFPGWEYKNRGLRGVFDLYPEEYDLLKKSPKKTWGTYAERLVRRRTADGDSRPLEVMINKMKVQLNPDGNGTFKACYEIGITECEYDLPLFSTARDQKMYRGLPCLSLLSFKLNDGKVHMTAIYRSHDYRGKVIGNLLGLARLQACVAKEVGQELGELVIHSTYAWLDGARGPLLRLIADLKDIRRIKG